MDPYIKRKIIKYQGASGEETEDSVAVEKKLRLFLNGEELITLNCTPSMIPELINGILLTENIVSDKIPSESITLQINEGLSVYVSVAGDAVPEGMHFTRCLGGFTFSQGKTFRKIEDNFVLAPENLMAIFQGFHQRSELFRLTGCFHSAALSDGKSILAFAEDIGRHNAVDKVTGYALLNDISFRGKLMLVSCRISSEIVSKCARWEIPVIASRGAATDLAVEIAEAAGMTLIGFVRGGNLNVYSNPQRIS
ncbi:MAG: formate dehydrogenase accessory sulfurtransferase FdhD [Thermodesulfovibrionales bacterium]|jgi:FdhD protein